MAKRIDSVTPPTELPKRQYHKGLYGANTPLALVELIESEVGSDPEDLLAYHRRRKLTIQYGNPLSGKAWAGTPGAPAHITGFIGLSKPTVDGEALQLHIKKYEGRKAHDVVLLNNIVRVMMSGGSVLYRHPLYHTHEDKPPVIEENQDTGGRALRRVAVSRHGSDSSEQTGDNP